jgi:hypothetical protein
LQSTGFKYATCDDSKTLLTACSDTAAARAVFLNRMHDIKQAGHTSIYSLSAVIIALMMGTEIDPETSVILNQLARLIALEDFIAMTE